MINYLKEKHRIYFHFIPFKLPVIIVFIIAVCYALYLLFGSSDGFFINIITELFGILVTIYIATYLLLKEERNQWGSVKNILQSKLKIYIVSFYSTLADSFSIDLHKEFMGLSYLTKGPDRAKLKNLVYDKAETSLNNFTGKDLDKFIDELSKEKKRLSEIITYMEKRPSFLHNIELFATEEKLDSIISMYWFQKLLFQIKDDKRIIDTSSSFVKNLISDIKEIISKLDDIGNKIKK